MFRKLTLPAVLLAALAAPVIATAATVETEITDFSFPFEGPFGKYDQHQLQRGLQVFTEVCSACHGLTHVAYRTLGDATGPGLPEDQVRAYAAQYQVYDKTLNGGQGGDRPATPADYFGGSQFQGAPDLSLMAKARAGFEGPYGTGMAQLFKGMGGPEYIASLVSHFEDPPACAPPDFPGYYNKTFAVGGYPEECKNPDGTHKYPGSWVAMPQPLYGNDVTYQDGTDSNLQQEAQDVAAFLMWAAEPKLDQRKQAGMTGVLFLTVLSVLLYLTNKRLWAPYKRRKHEA